MNSSDFYNQESISYCKANLIVLNSIINDAALNLPIVRYLYATLC